MVNLILAFQLLYFLYLLIVIFLIVLDNRSSSSTVAWLFVLIFLPFIGLIFYYLFGKNWRKLSRKSKNEKEYLQKIIRPRLKDIVKNNERRVDNLEKETGHPQKTEIIRLLNKNSDSLLTLNNKLDIFHKGSDKFSRLIEDLENAKESIHMEYFIWRSDELTKRIKEILIKKAKSGVKVRIIYDFIGGLRFSLYDKYSLRMAGAKLHAFSRDIRTLNYRSHRKIVVIDGKISYLGGMNMGKEYVDGGKKFPSWRDTHLRAEGEVSNIIQGIFAREWYNSTKEKIFSKKYFPKSDLPNLNLPMQIITSGPDSKYASIEQLYFSLINSTEKYVYIQTPYFIPSSAISMALQTIALRGLDVRLMITGIPDKKIPFWAAHTYFKNLIDAGVKIYHYKKGFLHSKTLTLDDELVSIGTANFDTRSFSLNYEISGLIYDKKTAKEMRNQFVKDIKYCKEIKNKDIAKAGILRNLRNSMSRILSPLL